MKSAIMLAAVATLTGCATYSGPTKAPKDAYTTMWSPKTSEAVGACLAQSGLASTYEARPLTGKDATTYQTIVVAKTPQWATDAEAKAYSRCL